MIKSRLYSMCRRSLRMGIRRHIWDVSRTLVNGHMLQELVTSNLGQRYHFQKDTSIEWWRNRTISQISQCITQISHNATFYWCYKMVCCGRCHWYIVTGTWVGYIVGFVRWVHSHKSLYMTTLQLVRSPWNRNSTGATHFKAKLHTSGGFHQVVWRFGVNGLP